MSDPPLPDIDFKNKMARVWTTLSPLEKWWFYSYIAEPYESLFRKVQIRKTYLSFKHIMFSKMDQTKLFLDRFLKRLFRQILSSDHLFHDWAVDWLGIVWVEFKKAIKFLSMRMEVIWYHYIKEGDRLPQKNSVFMLLKYFLVSQVRLSEVFWAEYRLLAQIMVEISPTWALHNLNICHRHLCPEAILISGTGHCKISRLHRATLMNHPCKMTEDVGVTGYKAPEVAACDKEGNHQGSTDV